MRRRKRKFWQPVVTGFMALYLITMLLATYLVKEKFADEYDDALRQYATAVLNNAVSQEFDVRDGIWKGENWEQERKEFYQELSNQFLWMIDNAYLCVSAAFYDEEKNLLAKSRNEISGWIDSSGGEYLQVSFGVDEFLSSEEKKELAEYETENILPAVESDFMVPGKYRFSIRVSPDGQELWGIMVQEITWAETPPEGAGRELMQEDPLTGTYYSTEVGGNPDFTTGQPVGETKEYYQSDSRIVWEWKNPALEEGKAEEGKITNASVAFPYLLSYFRSNDVYRRWEKWDNSEYLQNFSEQGEFTWEIGIDEPPLVVDADQFSFRAKYQLKIGLVDSPFGYAEVRMEGTPWLAAMDYMKYIYLAGLVMTLACMAKVIYVFHQTSKKQAALEETRRDFINAMAHELKTPLGVIRNFAENLMEHNMEEKRDYYLTQIIGQTEEMDGLVTEMIGISKLDSKELELRKENISFSELIREQMERFQPMIREKNIQVRYEDQVDFLADGDREYLARAVWNLLSNAVDYNIPGGSILVRIEGDRCVIENTGFPMSEEQLAHAFDLFYTEDHSRSGKDRHMGMGLFLAKKILTLHGMELALENTGDGVRAVIRKY